MKPASPSRRDFLRISAAAAASAAAASLVPSGRHGLAFAQEAVKGAAPLEKRKFGRTDMNVAILGFGGAEIGYERTDQATVSKLLNAALDAGLNVVDTAECYVDSEVQIATAIGHRRKEYYLFTKCGHAVDGGGRTPDWSKAGVLKSVERSLKRLKTDAVDLLQIHTCSLEELKRGEVIEAVEQAKKEGKTRYVGYSGDWQAARYAVECGRFDALQTSVSICDQECVELTLPLAKEKQVGVVAKRPIANAVWRYDKDPGGGHAVYWKRLQELDYAFAKGEARNRQDAEGTAGIALRFTAMQPGVDVLIVGTSKPERWAQNAELMRAGPLSKELAETIRARWKQVAKADWIGQA
jgi:aryl-alcohol dehydrogenase-like predicted oxidoreductase